MNVIDQDKILYKHDEIRIEPLITQIRKKDLKFRFFMTLVYPIPIFDYNRVLEDNKRLIRKLRTFYKTDLKIWIFNEKHEKDKESKFYNSYHRHLLIEDLTDWERLARSLDKFILKYEPKIYFEILSNDAPYEESKIKLLERGTKLCKRQISNGKDGIKTEAIYNLNGVLNYCTKQFEKHHPSYEVIDPSSTDIEDLYLFLKEYRQNGLEWKSRSDKLSEGSYLALRRTSTRQKIKRLLVK